MTCNGVCPGYVLTPLVEGQIAKTAQIRGISEDDVINKVLLAAHPTRKFTKTCEIAGLIEFLCSESANNVTGSMLAIDGGWSCH